MSEFLDRMKAAAKSDKKTIVLPEGEDPRTIEAAKKIVDEGLANLVILGDPATIAAKIDAVANQGKARQRSKPQAAAALSSRGRCFFVRLLCDAISQR